jgi:hypothetical protein
MYEYQFYCVGCREKRILSNFERIISKYGNHAVRSTCPLCSRTLILFIKPPEEESNEK